MFPIFSSESRTNCQSGTGSSPFPRIVSQAGTGSSSEIVNCTMTTAAPDSSYNITREVLRPDLAWETYCKRHLLQLFHRFRAN